MSAAGSATSGSSRRQWLAPLIYVAGVIALTAIAVAMTSSLLDTYAALEKNRAMLPRLDRQTQRASQRQDATSLAVKGPPFSPGKTITIAGAALQERVESAVKRAGGNVLSSQIDLQRPDSGAGFVGLTESLEINQPALQPLLYDLEAGMPYLFVESLAIRAPQAFGEAEGTRIAIFYDQSSGTASGVRMGRSASGWTLRAVDPHSATVEGSGRGVTLDLPEPSAQGNPVSAENSSVSAQETQVTRASGTPARGRFMHQKREANSCTRNKSVFEPGTTTPSPAIRAFERGAKSVRDSSAVRKERSFRVSGVSRQRRPADVANLVAREPARSVHGRAVVPHDEIARPPAMPIDEFRLRGVLGEIPEEHSRFGYRPADDGACVRRKEQGLAAGSAIDPHETVPDGTEVVTLLRRHFGKADCLPRINQRVLADEILEFRLRLLIQRLVGRAHVGKFRVASAGGDRSPGKQRVLRRDRTK